MVELMNGNIFVRHNMRDIFKVPPSDYVVEADLINFQGGNGIIQKKDY